MPSLLRAFFLFLGLLAVLAGIRSRVMSIRSQTWPSTRGRVLRSELVTDAFDDEARVAIQYEYNVGSTRYTGERVRHAGYRNTAQWQRELLQRFPRDAEVSVYFDANNPADAVLERSTNSAWLVAVLCGALFVGLAILAP